MVNSRKELNYEEVWSYLRELHQKKDYETLRRIKLKRIMPCKIIKVRKTHCKGNRHGEEG